jgi:hypothetical protein
VFKKQLTADAQNIPMNTDVPTENTFDKNIAGSDLFFLK